MAVSNDEINMNGKYDSDDNKWFEFFTRKERPMKFTEGNQLDNYLKVKRLISLFSISYAVRTKHTRKAIVNAAIMGYLVDGVNISELELLLRDPNMDIRKELTYFKRSMESYQTLCFVTRFYTYEDFVSSLYLLSQDPRFEKIAIRVMKILNKKDFFQFKNLD